MRIRHGCGAGHAARTPWFSCAYTACCTGQSFWAMWDAVLLWSLRMCAAACAVSLLRGLMAVFLVCMSKCVQSMKVEHAHAMPATALTACVEFLYPVIWKALQ